MRNRTNQKEKKQDRMEVFIYVSFVLLVLLCGRIIAQPQIAVVLEARPSSDCFPASDLQITDLKVHFERICPDCLLLEEPNETTPYRVVVEDPFLGWSVSVFNRKGEEIRSWKWSGGLDIGLKKTVRFLRQQQVDFAALKPSNPEAPSSTTL